MHDCCGRDHEVKMRHRMYTMRICLATTLQHGEQRLHAICSRRRRACQSACRSGIASHSGGIFHGSGEVAIYKMQGQRPPHYNPVTTSAGRAGSMSPNHYPETNAAGCAPRPRLGSYGMLCAGLEQREHHAASILRGTDTSRLHNAKKYCRIPAGSLPSKDNVAERLRRWTANPLGSPCAGSNPVVVDRS